MRTGSRLTLLAALIAGTAAPAHAADPRESAMDAVHLVRDLWQTLQASDDERGQRPRPQAVPAAGPEARALDLSDLSRPAKLEPVLRDLSRRAGPELRATVQNGGARLGDFSIGSDQAVTGHLLVLRGSADIYGRLLGNLVTVDGDVTVHPGAVVTGDVLTVGGRVRDQGGEIGGEIRELPGATQPVRAKAAAAVVAPPSPLAAVFRNAAGVLGVFLTLCGLGFGLVMFGQRNLEVVSDTVSHSFGRALVTGLVGQILILPTFGMLVVGLILSVAGILLLPFAVVVYALLVIVSVVGGYLAVAHAMGETYIRRRMAQGAAIGSPNSYRYLIVGLAGMLALWAAWATFGWVPVAGDLIRGAAILVTWLLGTAGFGAALLSRAGIRESFSGRLIPPEALTDEYLWATPQFGVPAVRRPGHRTPSSGL